MHGLHLTADLRDCPNGRAVMTEPEALLEALTAAFAPASAERHALTRGEVAP